MTPREREVVRGLIAGRTNREIAMDLSLTEQATRNILSAICAKCQVRNRLELSLLAVRKNLLAH